MELLSHISDDRPFAVNVSDHSSFSRPPDDQPLWRYSNMDKFVALLSTESIWLSRADQLSDPFEGSLGQLNLTMRSEWYKDLSPQMLAQLPKMRQSNLKHTFVSCWHESSEESAAMWSLYAEHAGIAVVTDYGRIRRAVGAVSEPQTSTKSIYVGRVQYADYDRSVIPEGNVFDAFMHKRQSFVHEREVRLILHDVPTRSDAQANAKKVLDPSVSSPLGVSVPVDLAELVAEVRVAPDAHGWLREAIEAVTRRFGLDVPVLQSDLSRDPIY